jgi:hypothetical protein
MTTFIVAVIVVSAIAFGLGSWLWFQIGAWEQGATTQLEILREIVKLLVQLVLIGILGALVKFLLDEVSASRREQDNERERARTEKETKLSLQKELLGKLSAAHRKVQSAPNYIEAARSAKTYGEQLRVIMDAKFDLDSVASEIETSTTLFSESATIHGHLQTMVQYLDRLVGEYRDEYQQLSTVQESVEAQEDERTKREARDLLWKKIQKLPHLKDLREAPEGSGYEREYLHGYNQCRHLMLIQMLTTSAEPTDTQVGKATLEAWPKT